MDIKNMNIGTVGYSLVLEASDEVKEALIIEGAKRILQGPTASEYEEKAIALVFPLAKDKNGNHNRKGLELAIERGDYPAFTDEDGKPRKFSRGDLPYSDALAKLWQKCVADAQVPIGTNDKGEKIMADLGVVDIETSLYEGAAAAVPKYAAERKFVKDYLSANGGKLQSGEPRTVESFAANPARNVPAPAVGPADEDGLAPWETDTAFLIAVREHMRSLAAGE